MNTTTHTTDAVFNTLASEWNAVLRASAADIPFLTLEWQSAFWRALGEGALNVIEVREEDGTLIGIAPLCRIEVEGKRLLRWVGGIDPSDYLDFVFTRGREAEIGAHVLDVLSADPNWDRIDLYNVPEASATRTWLARAAASRGWTCVEERQTVSPLLVLPDSFAAYLESLDGKERREMRRKLRRADATDGLRWYIVDGEYAHELEPEVDAFLDLMVRSHAGKADFMTAQMRRFFYEAVRAAHHGGWLQLAFLEVEGRKAATYLSFDYGDQLMVYNSGFEPEAFLALSPGIVLIARLIEKSIQQGKRAVDFMRGDEEYKYRLGAKDRWVYHISGER
jgi:CelD/BcsL family acetyltransferase involved in cellulose biosynthesis